MSHIHQNSTLLASLRDLKDHTHICGFYAHPDERLEILAAYYRVGLERGELCIFVTKDKPKDLIKNLSHHGLDSSDAVETDTLRIFPMIDTYMPDKTFRSPRMLNNLRNFVKRGMALGYNGVRGGGDMDWVGTTVPGRESVVDYESRINRFIRNNKFTGICLFPTTMLNSEMTQKIIQTHQMMLRGGGTLMDNPFYVPPEQSYKLDINIIADIESWLDELDEKEMKGAIA